LKKSWLFAFEGYAGFRSADSIEANKIHRGAAEVEVMKILTPHSGFRFSIPAPSL
jgi:hypothetical protein